MLPSWRSTSRGRPRAASCRPSGTGRQTWIPESGTAPSTAMSTTVRVAAVPRLCRSGAGGSATCVKRSVSADVVDPEAAPGSTSIPAGTPAAASTVTSRPPIR